MGGVSAYLAEMIWGFGQLLGTWVLASRDAGPPRLSVFPVRLHSTLPAPNSQTRGNFGLSVCSMSSHLLTCIVTPVLASPTVRLVQEEGEQVLGHSVLV